MRQSARLAPTYTTGGLLGCLPSFRRDPLELLMRGFGAAGDAVRFRLFTRSLILLAHPIHARHVLQERDSNYSKQTRGFAVLRDLLREGLLTSEGAHWLRQRRIAQPAFHRTRIASFGDTMTRAASELVEAWLESRESVHNISADMTSLTLRIVGETLLSTDVSRKADRVGQALSITQRAGNEALGRIFPRPRWWPSPDNLGVRAAMRTLDEVILEIIATRRTHGDKEDDLLSMLVAARDAETGERMSDAQLRDEVMTIFLAGHETTAIALGWTWYLLAHHPTICERLHDEVDSTLAGQRPGMVDLPRLGYVEQVVKESMRLYPPAWAISRCAIADDVVGGVRVPAGSIVLLSPYVTHRHPAFWERPEVFDPDRFGSDHDDRPSFAYLPFGGGPRQCIGNTFAMMELVLIVATIAQRCRLELTTPRVVGTRPMITLRPAAPITLTVAPR